MSVIESQWKTQVLQGSHKTEDDKKMQNRLRNYIINQKFVNFIGNNCLTQVQIATLKSLTAYTNLVVLEITVQNEVIDQA